MSGATITVSIEELEAIIDRAILRRLEGLKQSSVEITRNASGTTSFSVKEYEISTEVGARLARATFQELDRDFPAGKK